MTDTPSAIFFDMDGTILDWQTGMEESWFDCCETHRGASVTPQQMHEAIKVRRAWFWDDPERAAVSRLDLDTSARQIVRHAFADLGLDDTDRAHRLADDYRSRRDARIAPFSGEIDTLKTFQTRGIPMALITNGGAEAQRRSVERHGLARYFHCIVIEGEFGCGKPDERVFRHALTAIGSDPAATWMVGDSLEADIAGALPLGLHTIWIDEKGDGLPGETPTRPHRIIRAISELVS